MLLGSHFSAYVGENRMSAACQKHPQEGAVLKHACSSHCEVHTQMARFRGAERGRGPVGGDEGVLERCGGYGGWTDCQRPCKARAQSRSSSRGRTQAPEGSQQSWPKQAAAPDRHTLQRRHAGMLRPNRARIWASPALGALNIHRLHGI